MQKQKEEKELQEQVRLQKEQKRNIFKYATKFNFRYTQNDSEEDKNKEVKMTSEEIEKKFGFKNLNKGKEMGVRVDEYKFNKSENRNMKMIQKLDSYMKYLSDKYDFKKRELRTRFLQKRSKSTKDHAAKIER